MPEGHSVHRIARQFARRFVGRAVRVSSPQGRFAEGAAMLDGRTMTDAKAVGKQMFLDFEDGLWLRVHLGIYGAWDFAGALELDAPTASAGGRMGQTNQRGTVVGEHEDSLASIGAPRRARLRMAEQEKVTETVETWPPEPVGQVRVRLLTDETVADLRGPTACEVLDDAGVRAVLDRLGPDPQLDDGPEAEAKFVERLTKSAKAVGLQLMDQSVVAGIGNVYRAEILFRARMNPHTPARTISAEQARDLWADWSRLLEIGVTTGQMMTMDGLDEAAHRRALASRADRHWVYKREGLPCRVCGTHIVLEEMGNRKLYWCPQCQA
ncbi:Fpg/Nei family DNA glycosylase [Arenivirga flava]|uniref:DNA-(apurinic or apyrimidinic site) lyase n=1 Tax=Arenivirga flava TaxID=1930060 RepID=A0AA37UNK6_9MICO|nr:DNA-formamidopyrimidine glycosylase family protein [Arenivirga flava]GMA28221.1 formamidopyrimidine-DNA glycosylase [Arenivirga flava]